MTVEQEKNLTTVLLPSRPVSDIRNLPRHIIVGGAIAPAGFALAVCVIWLTGRLLGPPTAAPTRADA